MDDDTEREIESKSLNKGVKIEVNQTHIENIYPPFFPLYCLRKKIRRDTTNDSALFVFVANKIE